MNNKNNLYIESIDEESIDGKEVYLPSSVKSSPAEITEDMMTDLRNALDIFVNGLTNSPISGWSVEKIELGVSFSATTKAWIISLGGEGTIKVVLKPNK